MRRAIYAVFFVAVSLASPFPAAAQVADAKTGLGANAAMKYWQAFALLPNLEKDQEKLLDDWSNVPVEGMALKLLERSEQSRTYLLRGAMLLRCDWSLDYEDGILLVLPHLAKAMTLARLVALDARYEFEQGHWKAGWED